MMQANDRKPPLGVVFDSALDEGIDRMLGLTLLLGYDVRREARMISLSSSRNNLEIAAVADMMGRFFGSSPTIGMNEKGTASTGLPPMLTELMERKDADGKPLYNRRIEVLNDTADPVALIRNALTAQQDQNAAVILAGPPVNLLGFLALPESNLLIQKKVMALIVAAPFQDIPGFTKLVNDWPGPILAAGEDIQQALQFPGESIETDFSWATNHPLVDAYRAAKTMPYDAPTATMAAVLQVVHPEENYFKLSDPGTLVFAGGGVQFKTSPNGKHRQLILNPGLKERVIQTMRQDISSKPPEPRRGFRGQRG